MSKPRDTQIHATASEWMVAGIKRLIDAGEFATTAEYIRYVIRSDLEKRLAALDKQQSLPEN